jgi:hypothetical protein
MRSCFPRARVPRGDQVVNGLPRAWVALRGVNCITEGKRARRSCNAPNCVRSCPETEHNPTQFVPER